MIIDLGMYGGLAPAKQCQKHERTSTKSFQIIFIWNNYKVYMFVLQVSFDIEPGLASKKYLNQLDIFVLSILNSFLKFNAQNSKLNFIINCVSQIL